jgi:hypothetical protein
MEDRFEIHYNNLRLKPSRILNINIIHIHRIQLAALSCSLGNAVPISVPDGTEVAVASMFLDSRSKLNKVISSLLSVFMKALRANKWVLPAKCATTCARLIRN